jgi:hypothetical protein
VVEDPLEQRDIEGLEASLRKVIEVQNLELDSIARPASMLRQEVCLVDPMAPDIEAETLRGSELLRPERIPTGVACAVEERSAVQPLWIDPPHQANPLIAWVDEADRYSSGLTVVGISTFKEHAGRNLRRHLNLEMPGPEGDDALFEIPDIIASTRVHTLPHHRVPGCRA